MSRLSGVDVSVILPCYNVEKWLDQALSSAENNNRIALEIIAVNDGSTDNSLAIIEQHAQNDARIRIIDKPNEGYGASMNRGINEAQGRYIAILEPDDWVVPHAFDDLFEFAMSFGCNSSPDIVKSSYWRIVNSGTDHEEKLHCSFYKRITPNSQPFTLKDEPRLVWHHPSIWSALYKKEFLDSCTIRFKELPGAGWVDNPFLFETMCQAQTIVYTDSPSYCYREDLAGSSSSTRDLTLSFERWHDMCDVCDRLGVDDFGIRRSLTVIGFRYAGEAIGRRALEDEALRGLMTTMFERMNPEVIVSLTNVSPELRKLAFTLTKRAVPKMSKLRYLSALAAEFVYSVKVNGLGFAIKRTGIYRERRTKQDRESLRYTA